MSLRAQLHGLIRLTRWKEYVPFVVPLTVLGALMAARPNGILLDWRLVVVTLANILVVAYAFMINDIEDAPDDARDPARAARNPISTGEIGAHVGYAACRVVALITLALYALGGVWVLVIGLATLLLSHLYSWRPVRLKAWPVTDIVSHSLMLSGLLLLAGYFIYHTQPGINTAIILGETNTRILMYATVGLAAVCLLAAIGLGVFPLWLGIVVLISIPISMLISPKTDMRGSEAADASGGLQIQSLVVANMTIAVWLGSVILTQLKIIS